MCTPPTRAESDHPDSILLYPSPQPGWCSEFFDLPMPKLGDLPKDPELLNTYSHFYHSWLDYASLNPSRWRYDCKDFVRLRKFLTLPGRSPLKSLKIFTHGVKVGNPGYFNDSRDFDCKSDSIEDNILHIHDLMNDVKTGKVAGPFPLQPGQNFVKVFVRKDKFYKVPLFFANRFCTYKTKRLQTKGRRVTDLTGNGLNSFANQDQRSVYNLPNFHFLMALLNKKKYLFDFDYQAAYRNVPYSCDSWGLVSFCYNNKAFVDLSLTFGFCEAAYIMQN